MLLLASALRLVHPRPIMTLSRSWMQASISIHGGRFTRSISGHPVEADPEHSQVDGSVVEAYKEARLASLAASRCSIWNHAYENVTWPTARCVSLTEAMVAIPNGVVEQEGPTLSSLCGRILSRRDASSKLIFLTVADSSGHLQVVLSEARWHPEGIESPANDFQEMSKLLRRGDIITAEGHHGRTKRGEASLYAASLRLLSPCLKPLPLALNVAHRFEHRHLDFLVHAEAKQLITRRFEAMQALRLFMTSQSFLEVETPIISSRLGGANAEPFETKWNHSHNSQLSLRISPELYLKEMIIGGWDRVFEVGKVFRNEGISPRHSPEFTSMEFYAAYMSRHELMELTEQIIRSMAGPLLSHPGVAPPHQNLSWPSLKKEGTTICVAEQFAQVSFLPAIAAALSIPIADLPSLVARTAMDQWKQLLRPHVQSIDEAKSLAAVLDDAFSFLVQPTLIQPTFVLDIPAVLSPLAQSWNTAAMRPASSPEREGRQENEKEKEKEREKTPQQRWAPPDWCATPDQLTQRFELYLDGIEVVNAYVELNNPGEQRRRFEVQSLMRDGGDLEIPPGDDAFCAALEYGLPPTCGWGMGIDRMIMLLSGSRHIREVIAFPLKNQLHVKP